MLRKWTGSGVPENHGDGFANARAKRRSKPRNLVIRRMSGVPIFGTEQREVFYSGNPHSISLGKLAWWRWLAYNLGNFLRTLATPEPIKDWSMRTLKEKLIKIGAKVVSHGRYVAFQMAEVAIPRNLFGDILRLIAELRPPPDPAPA